MFIVGVLVIFSCTTRNSSAISISLCQGDWPNLNLQTTLQGAPLKLRLGGDVQLSQNLSSSAAKLAPCQAAPPLRFLQGAGDEDPKTNALLAPRFYDFNVRTEGKRIEKLLHMHSNPVKRGLALEPEQWRWSGSRSYAFGEVGLVRINDCDVLRMTVRDSA